MNSNEETHIEPLEPELSALLEYERPILETPPSLARALESQLGLTAAALGPGVSAPPSPPVESSVGLGTALAKTWWVVAVGVTGAFAAGVFTGKATPPPPLPTPVEVVQPLPQPPLVPAPVEQVKPAPTVELTPAPVPSPTAKPKSLPATGLTEERLLLDGARAALGRQNWAEAKKALAQHQQRFPRGQLAEDRMFIEVELLYAQGEVAQGRAKAAEFRRQYPGSFLLPAVEELESQHRIR